MRASWALAEVIGKAMLLMPMNSPSQRLIDIPITVFKTPSPSHGFYPYHVIIGTTHMIKTKAYN